MFRLFLIFIILFASTCFATENNKIEADRYKVLVQKGRQVDKFYGTDYDVTADSVMIITDSGKKKVFSIFDVRKLSYERKKAKLWPGIFVGVGVGYLVGLAVEPEKNDNDFVPSSFEDGTQKYLIATAGGLVGLLIGSTIKYYKEIDLNDVTTQTISLNIYPCFNYLTNTPQLSLQIRF